ncbi:MAG TPA: D-aminoacyl-tRNA deacylase [Candidatus Eremiobacteraceae bacterium]|nr:D-aminoacyl-tRNA deacylase [Candidatus Eremiobacteraceae bacterium]
MRAVVQRVSAASVRVGDRLVGEIGAGFVALVGVARDDDAGDADVIAAKIIGLRLFDDSAGVMNLSLADIGGAVLAVSQFTLYGDARKGRRPSFIAAAPGDHARPLFDHVVHSLRRSGVRTETGEFGAEMLVTLTNDGPVTILLDSRKSF